MKKIFYLILLLLIVFSTVVLWRIFGPTISNPTEKYLYIKTESDFNSLTQKLADEEFTNNIFGFKQVSKHFKFTTVKPGKYLIKNGTSIFNLVRMLKNGTQDPVRLVIPKLRTKEALAQLISKHFEIDSIAMIQFLIDESNAQTNYGTKQELLLTYVLPNTYFVYWNESPKIIFDKFYAHSQKFWNEERRNKAAAINLSQQQVYILASIIDEESNFEKEKGMIASVYLNRLKLKMPLQADPTIKYALNNFLLKRIMQKHLTVNSPYNTYKNKGLPPGPICIAQASTINAILNAPKTNYLYFVANVDFSQTHLFSSNYQAHIVKAKKYQQALNKLMNNDK